MVKLHRSETAQEAALRQAAVIQDLIGGLERTVQILNIDIYAEEERVRVFDRSEPTYPILARTLTARRDKPQNQGEPPTQPALEVRGHLGFPFPRP